MDDLYLIDGCTFTEGVFIGLSERVKKSLLTAFFLTTPGESDGFRECVSKIGGLYNFADRPDSGFIIARTADDIVRAKREGKKALIITFQDPQPVENSLDKLRTLYELGLRVMQMTYNKANYIGTGCIESVDGGLTDFGREALRKMNELGIVADVSHCGHKTTQDVLKYSEKPIVISHSCPLALTDNVRNKTDEELLMLKKNGGVIGVSSWGPLCWKNDTVKGRPSLADYVDHIDYVVNLIGIDHIGYGSDSTPDDTKDEKGLLTQSSFYAPVVDGYNRAVGINPATRYAVGVDGPWDLENVFAEMRRRGYSEEDIYKYAGGNFMRVLRENWK